MIKFSGYIPLVEPTHTRVGFYAIPLIVWILLSMFFQPHALLDYIFTIAITLIFTIVVPSFLVRKPDPVLSALSNTSKQPENELRIASNETILLCGKMSVSGAIVYGFAIIITIVSIVLLYAGGYPSPLLTIPMALVVDFSITILLYYTDTLDLFCSTQASPEGLSVYGYDGKLRFFIKWEDVDFDFFDIGFGLTKCVVTRDRFCRRYILDHDALDFVKHHLGRTA